MFTQCRIRISVTLSLALIYLGTATACQRNTDLALLDEVSTLIAEEHYDPNLHGLDWNSVHAKYQALVRKSSSRSESIRLINAMLQELGDSHCGVGNLTEVLRASSPYLFGEGSVGLDIRLINDQAIITKVEEGSPAEAAGMRRGYTLVAVNNNPVEQIIASAPLRPPFTHSNRKFHHTEAVLWQLFGPAGTPVTINFKDAKEINHSVTLMREKRLGGVSLFPSLPPMFIDEDKRVLAGGISYLWFNVFQPNHPAQLLAAIDDLDEQKPLIIDLRGNNGGSANATLEILSRFARDRFLAYHRVDRVNSTSIYVEPTNPDHRWSSVVLVDELSISAAENFAAIMQHAGLASVVGTQTPGQLLWGEGYELDNDLLAVIPIAQLIYPDGTNIEGRGVEPNLVVALRREDLLQGVDTQLRAAIELLQAQTSSMIIDDK